MRVHVPVRAAAVKGAVLVSVAVLVFLFQVFLCGGYGSRTAAAAIGSKEPGSGQAAADGSKEPGDGEERAGGSKGLGDGQEQAGGSKGMGNGQEQADGSKGLGDGGEQVAGSKGLENGQEADTGEQARDLLEKLGLAEIDDYLQQEDLGQMTFSQLVKELMGGGAQIRFSDFGKKLKNAVFAEYQENRKALIRILTLAIAFSVLLQMTASLHKNYISEIGFLGIYLMIMLLLLRLFVMLTGTVEEFFTKLVDFMRLLQPAFCMSMVFSTGSISAGAYYQLLLLLIYLVDALFAKVLLPVVQVYMVLQLVNHLTEERFSRIAGLLSDSVHWCVKVVMTSLIGLNVVQGLLAPGIDGLKRAASAGAIRAIPGAGQILNSMTEILAGSAMLIKNSVGVAALVVLLMISFLPLVKTAVFLILYRACAAFLEPVADKRFCAACAALGQSAALYLKLMFYAVLLFFLTTAIICAATTLLV